MKKMLGWSVKFLVLGLAVANGVHATPTGPEESTAQAHVQSVVQPPWQQETPHVLIGQETDYLMALQRANLAQRLRMIDGDQVSRSYTRYLKSFEYPIPEKYEVESMKKD